MIIVDSCVCYSRGTNYNIILAIYSNLQYQVYEIHHETFEKPTYERKTEIYAYIEIFIMKKGKTIVDMYVNDSC